MTRIPGDTNPWDSVNPCGRGNGWRALLDPSARQLHPNTQGHHGAVTVNVTKHLVWTNRRLRQSLTLSKNAQMLV